MRKKIFPKYRCIELDDVKRISKSNLGSVKLADISELFKKCNSAFMTKMGYKKGDEEGLTLVHSTFGTNVPLNDVCLFQIGTWMALLAKSPFEESTVLHYLTSESALAFDADSNDAPFIMRTPGDKKAIAQILSTLTELINNSHQWVIDPSLKPGSAFTEKKIQITKFIDCIMQIQPNVDSSRLSSVIWGSIIKSVYEFAVRFLEDFARTPQWRTTQPYDLVKAITDPKYLANVFINWVSTEVNRRQYEMYSDRLKIDMSEVEISNGMMSLPKTFFDEITQYAVLDAEYASIEMSVFDRNLTRWFNAAPEMAKLRRVCAHEG